MELVIIMSLCGVFMLVFILILHR